MNLASLETVSSRLLKNPSETVEIATTAYCLKARTDIYYGVGAAGLIGGLILGVIATKVAKKLKLWYLKKTSICSL